MRNIVAAEFLSLDGVMEAPNEWHSHYVNDEMAAAQAAQLAEWDTMLLGRRTYEEFAAVWPGRTSAEFGPFADFMNNTPKVVVSKALASASWHNSTVLRDKIAAGLVELKQRPGKTIVVIGSASLVRFLLREGLIDQLQLILDPILVGSGKRLFDGAGQRTPLKLVDSRALGTGSLVLTYEPAAG